MQEIKYRKKNTNIHYLVLFDTKSNKYSLNTSYNKDPISGEVSIIYQVPLGAEHPEFLEDLASLEMLSCRTLPLFKGDVSKLTPVNFEDLPDAVKALFRKVE
jgi:hypothetical protein